MIKRIFPAVGVMIAVLALPVSAAVFSDAAKVGASAGAMKYCRDHYMTKDDNGRYGLLLAATTKDFVELKSGKPKAVVVKRAAENGDYLGERLTRKRCTRLRKALMLKYAID